MEKSPVFVALYLGALLIDSTVVAGKSDRATAVLWLAQRYYRTVSAARNPGMYSSISRDRHTQRRPRRDDDVVHLAIVSVRNALPVADVLDFFRQD